MKHRSSKSRTVNPWAVCTAQFGPRGKKRERCIMAVKRNAQKYGRRIVGGDFRKR